MANVIWMTGLSGSGKSTIADEIRESLKPVVVLDGDIVRAGLCKGLGFSLEDRNVNISRIAHAAKIIVDCGIDVIVPVIAPTTEIRNMAKSIIGDKFKLIWIKCPLSICENRDVKGLYKKARSGEIKNFTGIGSPFNDPIDADVICDTSELTISMCADNLLKAIRDWD